MQTYLTLSTGQHMPLLGLGTWHLAPSDAGPAVTAAVQDAGYRHIDCASVYKNEPEIGKALAPLLAGPVKREDVFITSKLWNTKHHPDNVEKACRKTLEDLGLEYLDLYLMHWGIAFKAGDEKEPMGDDGYVTTEPVSVQDTWKAMEALVDKGLVRAIGVSNFTGPMIVDLLSYATVKPAMNQIELHPYLVQEDLVKFCKHHDIAVTAYSPLGSEGSRLLTDGTVQKIAATHNKSAAQVLLRWSVQRDMVTLPRSKNPERIAENAAIFDFELSAAECAEITKLDKHRRVVSPVEWWGVPYFD